MDSIEDVNTFSFLSALPSEQDAFLQQMKEIHTDDAVSSDSSEQSVESIFSFTPALSFVPVPACKPTNIVDAMPQPAISMPLNFKSSGRSWKLLHVSALLVNTSLLSSGSLGTPSNNSLLAPENLERILDEVRVDVRTRSDPSHLASTVPDRLYSSLKYEMKHFFSKTLVNDSSNVLMTKVEIVNPQDHFEEITKTNGEKLIKGITEMTALARNSSGTALECKMKIQFTDVSYHHEKKYFAFKVSYFDPSINIEDPILILLSAPFQVFARRPTARKPKESKSTKKHSKVAQPSATIGTKRKTQTPVAAPSAKKVKTELVPIPPLPASATSLPSSIQLKAAASLTDFLKCLDLLVAFKNSLSGDELKTALTTAQKKLFQQQQMQLHNQLHDAIVGHSPNSTGTPSNHSVMDLNELLIAEDM